MQRLHSKNAFSNKMPWSVNKDKTENENPPTDQTMRMENEEKNKTPFTTKLTKQLNKINLTHNNHPKPTPPTPPNHLTQIPI